MGMENFGDKKNEVEGFDIKKRQEAGLTQSEQDISKKYLEEAGLTQPEQAIYKKYLKNIEVNRKEKFSLKGFAKAFQSNPDDYTEEEQELLKSVFDKIRNLENKEQNLFEEQKDIILKALTNPEEKDGMFQEAGLTPEERVALEKYLEHKRTLPLRVKNAWKKKIIPGSFYSPYDIPNDTPGEESLRDSAFKKLISIQKGKQEYSI